ncbi:MAG: BrnT family toxin, partial [Leptospirales bacterium]
MEIEFDPSKAEENRKKHGVSLSDSEPVLYDPRALTLEDTSSEMEQRFITVGMDALGRILTVVWTEREDNIRIISARQASKKERKNYEEL